MHTKRDFDSLLYEVDSKHMDLAKDFFFELDLLLYKKNLPIDTIEIQQIKSKFGRLRVYLYCPALCEDLSERDYEFYTELMTNVDLLVDKYDSGNIKTEF